MVVEVVAIFPDFRRRFRLSVIRLFMVLVSKEEAKRLLIPWF